MKNNLSKYMSHKLISINLNAKVEEALMLMKSHDFRHLPVKNKTGQIVGILSDRDLYKSLNSEEIEVSQIMTKNVYKFELSSNIKDVVDAMVKFKFSAFLVTKSSHIVGIVTSEDMLLLLSQILGQNKEHKTLLEDFVLFFNKIDCPLISPSTFN